MTADELFEQATLSWRDNHGVGTAFVPAPLNDKVLVYKILSRIYSRSPATTTIIIVEQFSDRSDIIEFLTHQDNEENNEEFKQLLNNKLIRIFTKAFLISGNWNSAVTLCILYRPDDYDLGVHFYFTRCHYRLCVLNKLLNSDKNKADLYKKTPLLDVFKQAELDEMRISSPVEEMWIDVAIPEDSEDWKLYQYYTKYIETSLNIFGSFDIMQQARVGNATLNISSATICAQIAQENGWNEHLDMSYGFNRQIDELYNPNNLRDRATQTYEAVRNRSNLVTDYNGKLEQILKLVKENEKAKILIISKRGQFAKKVTDYINNNSETDICGDYHNQVDDIPAVDIDGNPIYIKSGPEKGKRKSMGYKAQMTLNERKFNADKLRCLSLSNSPDKSLSVNVDVVIITSPMCEDIKSYLYRLSNVAFNYNTIKLFSIFCRNTIEQQKLFNKPTQDTHLIVNKDEIMAGGENNSDFLIVD